MTNPFKNPAASGNQALLDELKCEVELFLGSGLTERFTVTSPNGGFRTEVRDVAAARETPESHFGQAAKFPNMGF